MSAKSTNLWKRAIECIPDAMARRLAFIRRQFRRRTLDREFLEQQMAPWVRSLALERILLVGCRGYTIGYDNLFAGPATEVWTLDRDEDAARWGVPRRHVTADVSDVASCFPPEFFSAVLLNGVFGWGVDSTEHMSATLQAISTTLSRKGYLLIGWNTDRCCDPLDLPEAVSKYEVAVCHNIPARKTFPGLTHVYDLLQRRGSVAVNKD